MVRIRQYRKGGLMGSAKINPKNPQGNYLVRPTYDQLDQIRLFAKNGGGGGWEGYIPIIKPRVEGGGRICTLQGNVGSRCVEDN